MSRRKKLFLKIDKQASRVDELGRIELDFSHLFEGGRVVSLREFQNWPRLVKDISLAIWAYFENSADVESQSTVNIYVGSVRYFWKFIDENVDAELNKSFSSIDITNELFDQFREWMERQSEIGIYTRNKIYQRVRRLFEALREHHPSRISGEFNPLGLPMEGAGEYVSNVQVYTTQEIKRIEKACRDDINALLKRLRKGQELLGEGCDPRGNNFRRDEVTGRMIKTESKWAKLENLVWYVVHNLDGQYYKSSILRKGHSQFLNALNGAREEYIWSRSDVYGCLYPLVEDLLAFIVMLGVKTGLNHESIITLKRDCLVPSLTINDGVTVRYQKTRSANKYEQKTFSDSGRFSPGQLIKEVLRITEPLVRLAPKSQRDYLWLCLMIANRKDPVKALTDQCYVSYLLNNREGKGGWCVRHGLENDDGTRLSVSIRRLRKTDKNRKYIKTGNLGQVSKDAKHAKQRTTVDSYLDKESIRPVHERTIAESQSNLVSAWKGIVVDDRKVGCEKEAAISSSANVSMEDARSLSQGEQDVFIASCKDFYNSPGSPRGKPCQNVWGCFTCENAVWLSRILPKLIKFMRFIESQRKSMHENEWLEKFWVPYAVMRHSIFPEFSRETMEWAERAAEQEVLFISNGLRAN